jgi:hypothetical protein
MASPGRASANARPGAFRTVRWHAAHKNAEPGYAVASPTLRDDIERLTCSRWALLLHAATIKNRSLGIDLDSNPIQ